MRGCENVGAGVNNCEGLVLRDRWLGPRFHGRPVSPQPIRLVFAPQIRQFSLHMIDKSFLSHYTVVVIRSFRHRGLKRLWEGDPSRVSAALRDRLENVLSVLDAASNPRDLDLPGYRLHPLKGELTGVWSVTISGNWRVTFRMENGNALEVDLTDYH